jgi:hypothetical protein
MQQALVCLDSTTATAFSSKRHGVEIRNPQHEFQNTDSWQKNGGRNRQNPVFIFRQTAPNGKPPV